MTMPHRRDSRVAGLSGGAIALLAFIILLITPRPIAAATGQSAVSDYIILFNENVYQAEVPEVARSLTRSHGGTVHFTYSHAVRGFAARLPDVALDALRRDPRVASIEPDGPVQISDSGSQSPTPSWGLDRIDQRNLPLNTGYTYNFSGTGVTAYIIDTGVDGTNSDFGGRVRQGFDAIGGSGTGSDCNGHGTHVSGTVGGATYGVAKTVAIVAVRVLNCQGSGTWSGVIAGIDWVTGDRSGPAVANMSLGGGANKSVDEAVERSIASGISYAVAAGNSGANACNYSPARVPAALTVGATNSTDTKSSWSNYGSCLDLFAPGVSIKSDWLSGGTNTISGTSMAAPHVAGAVARYLEEQPSASPSNVASAVVSAATTGIVQSAGVGSPNRLLYVAPGGDTPPPATGTVSGSVRDASSSQGIAGATITVANISGTTGSDGSYSLSSVPTGAQSVAVTASGYSPYSTVLEVVAAPTATTLDVLLAPTTTVTVHATSFVWSTSGGKSRNKNLTVSTTIRNESNGSVSGALVSILLQNGSRSWTGSATTGSNGSVSINLSNAPSGAYTATIVSVTGNGLEWDGVQPGNANFTK